ncbi:unnamed protein product, partial [marine sediment metagenome]
RSFRGLRMFALRSGLFEESHDGFIRARLLTEQFLLLDLRQLLPRAEQALAFGRPQHVERLLVEHD